MTIATDQVTVTGTLDPSDCTQPTLTAVRYTAGGGVIHLTIGTESLYGQTPTIEWGTASFDLRSVFAIDQGRPTAVEVE